MFFRRFFYFFGKVVNGTRQRAFINFLNIGTIAISLLVLSTFLIIFFNMNRLLDSWKDEFRATVYLDDNISLKGMARVKKRIADSPEVETVKYISKIEAIHILRETLQADDSAFEGLEINPLPSSFELRFKREYFGFKKIESFVTKIKGFNEISDIEYDREWVKGFSTFLNYFGVGSLMLGIGLFLAAVFIISSTIRLSVFGRGDELEIMRLVGATNFFIRAPFFIEGLIQGLFGALLSIGLLYAVYHVSISTIGNSISLYLRGPSLSFLPLDFVLGIVFGGILIGVSGSMVSLERFLRI